MTTCNDSLAINFFLGVRGNGSYSILCPAIAKSHEDPTKSTAAILEVVALDAELFRIGHTKAGFLLFERMAESVSYFLRCRK